MFGMFWKRQRTPSSTTVPRVPGGAESLAMRGAWLGSGTSKQHVMSLESLTALSKTPSLTKQTQNCIRLELAMFCLSRSARARRSASSGTLPRSDKRSTASNSGAFSDSAWHSVGLFKDGPGSVDDPYDHCAGADAESALLWERLDRCGINIDLDTWADWPPSNTVFSTEQRSSY